MAKEKPLRLLSEEGTIEVTRTVLGKPSTKVEKIKIRPFVTEPAWVEAHMGFWLPTGDMRGAKVDVTIKVPCYVEELLDMYKQVRNLVDKLLEKEHVALSGDEEE